jgi:hypothetical protein
LRLAAPSQIIVSLERWTSLTTMGLTFPRINRSAKRRPQDYGDSAPGVGEEQVAAVRCSEVVANRAGPEPCAVGREAGDEASAGVRTSQPLSRERNQLGRRRGLCGRLRAEARAAGKITARNRPATRPQSPRGRRRADATVQAAGSPCRGSRGDMRWLAPRPETNAATDYP